MTGVLPALDMVHFGEDSGYWLIYADIVTRAIAPN
jgi:hypothetical protein